MADIKANMPNIMAGSIEALFIILSHDKPLHYRSNTSMDKFAAFICSWSKEQISLIVNTRSMSIFLPKAKRVRILDMLTSTWYEHRKLFTLLEGDTLLGNLNNAALVDPGSDTSIVRYRVPPTTALVYV